MSIWQIIGCVMLYLAVGAVIDGVGDVDMDSEAFFGVMFFWPLVMAMLVLTIIAMSIRALVHGFKEHLHEQEDM